VQNLIVTLSMTTSKIAGTFSSRASMYGWLHLASAFGFCPNRNTQDFARMLSPSPGPARSKEYSLMAKG
jgi:hypothetical protein